MADSFVTQCPNCQTSFRVTYHQLSAARGAVRCGACLQVFNAAKQLLEQSNAGTKVAGSPAEASQRVEPTSQRRWAAAAEIDLEQLNLDDELARLEHRSAPPGHGGASQDLLSATRDEGEQLEPDVDIRSLRAPAAPTLRAERDGATDQADGNHAVGDAPLVQREPALSPATAVNGVARERDAGAPKHSRAAGTRAGKRAEPRVRNEDLPDLSEDPFQLQWQKPHSTWRQQLLWGALSLAAALTLVGQYAGYHFDELARQDAYRPWYQQLCSLAGCEVPAKVDIAQVKSNNLVVRNNPQFSGALQVDAIIYNRAPFIQPFPLLELRFADLDGRLIASRRFKPSEYLSGDFTGQRFMPTQTPIHIALDILDPGSKAVNYSLSFQAPE